MKRYKKKHMDSLIGKDFILPTHPETGLYHLSHRASYDRGIIIFTNGDNEHTWTVEDIIDQLNNGYWEIVEKSLPKIWI